MESVQKPLLGTFHELHAFHARVFLPGFCAGQFNLALHWYTLPYLGNSLNAMLKCLCCSRVIRYDCLLLAMSPWWAPWWRKTLLISSLQFYMIQANTTVRTLHCSWFDFACILIQIVDRCSSILLSLFYQQRFVSCVTVVVLNILGVEEACPFPSGTQMCQGQVKEKQDILTTRWNWKSECLK